MNNFEIFNYFLPTDTNKSFTYLEIGSYEGMSLLYTLEKYKNANITAIDLWNDNNSENSFNKNTNKYLNLIKIKSDSIIALRELNKKNKKFNYIYIDGFHDGSHVIFDAIESFKFFAIRVMTSPLYATAILNSLMIELL
jgi:predicted O-methyltransferase YrrM